LGRGRKNEKRRSHVSTEQSDEPEATRGERPAQIREQIRTKTEQRRTNRRPKFGRETRKIGVSHHMSKQRQSKTFGPFQECQKGPDRHF